MLLDYIERLREKPRAARKRFAFMCATVVTSVVALGWVVTLPARFAGLSSVGPLGTESADDLGAAVSEAGIELQETINMEELGYKPEEPFIVNNENESSSEIGIPGTVPVVGADISGDGLEAPKSRPVIIATTSSERAQ